MCLRQIDRVKAAGATEQVGQRVEIIIIKKKKNYLSCSMKVTIIKYT